MNFIADMIISIGPRVIRAGVRASENGGVKFTDVTGTLGAKNNKLLQPQQPQQ